MTIVDVPQTNVVDFGVRATSGGRACLVRIHPMGLSDCLTDLCEEETRIGSDPHCEVELVDDYLAREHAVIEHSNGQYIIHDCGSINGTFVNDIPIRMHKLAPGDQIRLGNHIFKFLSGGRSEALYHEAAFEMMTLDGLTGVHNQRYFEDAFAREILRAQRHWRPITLFFLDIDHYQRVNDRFGHLAGNECLKGLCTRVCSRIRGEDLFARFGGGKLALSLTEAPLKQSVRIAQDLRRLVEEQPIVTSQGDVDLTVSIGVGFASGDGPATVCDLYRKADENLLRAKSEGRNCVRY